MIKRFIAAKNCFRWLAASARGRTSMPSELRTTRHVCADASRSRCVVYADVRPFTPSRIRTARCDTSAHRVCPLPATAHSLPQPIPRRSSLPATVHPRRSPFPATPTGTRSDPSAKTPKGTTCGQAPIHARPATLLPRLSRRLPDGAFTRKAADTKRHPYQ